jgi:hypothetical protein
MINRPSIGTSGSRFPKAGSAQSRSCLVAVVAALFTAGLGSAASAGVTKAAYPEVKVTVSAAYKPDAAFEKMRAAFADAVAKSNVNALSALIAPMFLWTIGGQPADEMDLGRPAVNNFKVVFGFRVLGKDVDGGVDDGPYWDTLAAFANDPGYYAATDSGNLVCGPITADVADEDMFDQARQKIETGGDGTDWYFTLRDTGVISAPNDKGTPVAKVGTIAMPVLSVFPAAPEGQSAPEPTYVEVLLPSGKSGWIKANAVRPLFADHLCYARTASGDWRIAAVDQPSQ